MKHTLLKSALFLACFSLLISCGEENNGKLQEIAFDSDRLTLNVGSYEILQLRVTPSDAIVSSIIWESSNPETATITNGLVMAVSYGTAVITARVENLHASINVIVSSNITPGENVDNAIRRLPRDPNRGVSFGFWFEEDVHLLNPGIGWSYNWGTHPHPHIEELFRELGHDFFPMVWSVQSDATDANIREFIARNPHIRYIQAFNEPNLIDQANMTPSQAAERWPRFRDLANELGLKIVSPSLNWGTMPGYHDPNVWFDEFLAHPNVDLEDIYAISIHSYIGSLAGFKSFIDRFRRYNRPIWMTEWCAWYNTSPRWQMSFMSQSIQLMQADPMVTRHAWFIPRAGMPLDAPPYMQLIDRNQPPQLTDLGRVFVNLSSKDRTVWQPVDNHILAQTYSNTSASETEFFAGGRLVLGPPLRIVTDETGDLEIHNFIVGQWVEYQIDVTRPVSSIRLRYANFINTTIEVLLEGNVVSTIVLPATGSDIIWNTATADISLPQGRHTIRLRVADGMTSLNWLKIE